MKKFSVIIISCILIIAVFAACAAITVQIDNGTADMSSQSDYIAETTTEETTETTTEETTATQSSENFDENFLEAAYALVSKKHTVDKEDFMKNAEFISGYFYPSVDFYQIRYNNQVMGYISVDFEDNFFHYSFSERDDYATPASSAELIDGVWCFDESHTLA